MGLIRAQLKERPIDYRSFGVTKVTHPLKPAKYFIKYFMLLLKNSCGKNGTCQKPD
jgi:hypothetical protein